jgi:hypothetical protein
MRRSYAKQLAENVTNQELREMFYNAQRAITQWGGWEKVSKVNKSISTATAFNILSCGVDSEDFLEQKISPITKFNMIREFGEYLPNYQPEQTKTKPNIKITHHEPKFLK